MRLVESEVYVDKKGYAHDDEGNMWRAPTGARPGTYKGGAMGGPPSRRPQEKWKERKPTRSFGAQFSERQKVQLKAIDDALEKMPDNKFLQSVRKQVYYGRFLSDKQKKVVRGILKKIGMKDKVKIFEGREDGMRALIERLECLFEEGTKTEESYPSRGMHIRQELEKRFPKEYKQWMDKAKEGFEAEKKFFAGKGKEYFELASRLHADADTLYQKLKRKAGIR